MLAVLCREEKNYSLALKYNLEAALTPNQETRMVAKRYLEIGSIYQELNKIDSAHYYADKGLAMVTATKKNWLHAISNF